MAYQNISAVLSQADMDAIIASVGTIEQKLSFAVVLEESEKQALVKLGPKSLDFVEDANRAVKNFPQVIPESINKDEFDKDATLYRQLSNVKIIMGALFTKVSDTHMAVGSEAMKTSLKVYKLVDAQKALVPGLQAVYEKLRERFSGQTKPRKKKED